MCYYSELASITKLSVLTYTLKIISHLHNSQRVPVDEQHCTTGQSTARGIAQLIAADPVSVGGVEGGGDSSMFCQSAGLQCQGACARGAQGGTCSPIKPAQHFTTSPWRSLRYFVHFNVKYLVLPVFAVSGVVLWCVSGVRRCAQLAE